MGRIIESDHLEAFLKSNLQQLFREFTAADCLRQTFDCCLKTLNLGVQFSPYYLKDTINFQTYESCTPQQQKQVAKQLSRKVAPSFCRNNMMLLYYQLEYLACHWSGNLLQCFDLVTEHRAQIQHVLKSKGHPHQYWAWLVVLLMGDIRLEQREVEWMELGCPSSQ